MPASSAVIAARDHGCRTIPQQLRQHPDNCLSAAIVPRLDTAFPGRVQGSAAAVRLEAVWAAHQDDVREAQRLRHRVFAGEMGAKLTPPTGTPAGLDVDVFDAYSEHLPVRTVKTADTPAQAVGTLAGVNYPGRPGQLSPTIKGAAAKVA
jgi:putative hemolysin